MIALRARREAYHIASDMIYEERIDVRRVECCGCGQWLDVHGPVTDPLICPACHARTPLPAYLRARYMPRWLAQSGQTLNLQTSSWQWGDLVSDGEPSSPVPKWMIWFSVILGAILIGTIAGMLS